VLAAFDWKSAVLGALGLLILVGGALAALGQIGRTWTWAVQRFRPSPPRVELEGWGGQSSHQRDEVTKEITWTDVRPGFVVRNDEPVSVYAVTAGIVNPNGDDRITHPQRVAVLKAETSVSFESTEAFKIPPTWLAGVAANEHQAVPYFVTLTDADERKWDGVIDFREVAPRLRFRRA
jgi:hypothetical protein